MGKNTDRSGGTERKRSTHTRDAHTQRHTERGTHTQRKREACIDRVVHRKRDINTHTHRGDKGSDRPLDYLPQWESVLRFNAWLALNKLQGCDFVEVDTVPPFPFCPFCLHRAVTDRAPWF